VTVHRYGELAGRPYLVSEYIRGESLDKLAKPVAWDRALEIGVALARGLAAAHRHGIVHRDIKPANAILTAEGDAKLVDFGLAKLDRHEVMAAGSSPAALGVAGLTQAGAIAGTPRYLSPEVRRGEPAGRRSDVYQLGCILYELVTGRAPLVDLLARQAETAGSDVPSIANGSATRDEQQVPSLVDQLGASSGVGPDVTLSRARVRFAAVVDRCLRHDPEERFASGDELREALEKAQAPARSTGELPAGNPYRGLVPFEAEHRALFFGRDADIRSVIERLRSESFVLVTGDSGVGKSSLCRAGVLPRIVDGAFGEGDTWSVVQLVPGLRPLTTLASLLADELDLDERELATTMREEPTALARELRRARGADGGLVVFVDQLEELATLAERSEAEPFARVLAELVTGMPGLRLLATVRSDFLTRVAELPSIGGEIARAIYLLRPLSAEGAREAIVGPAKATGVRFESEQLVAALVASVDTTAFGPRQAPDAARSVVELPLLAFTLAQLWDARDQESETISARSLEAIGGVKGALARHADGVLDSLLPDQRASARKLLLRLVTAERTRARRGAAELASFDRAALDALVRGRLVVARGAGEPAFELAHERLIDGWPMLAGWISETTEAIVVHARLATAVADWDRLGRAKDSLWSTRRIADLAIISPDDLTEHESAFVHASRRAVARKRWLRGGIAVAIPLAIISLYVGARLVARRDLDRHIAHSLDEASVVLVRAREERSTSAKLRTEALAQFDAGDATRGETLWERSQQHGTAARAGYTQAAGALEAAFLLDTTRADLRRELARVTFERIQLAELEHRDAERGELAARLELYDEDLAAGLFDPGRITTAVEPAGSTVSVLGANGMALAGPSPKLTFTPGTYIVEASGPGRATVRVPLVLRAGEHRHVALQLPPAAVVPAGFVYIPAGSFLFGSRDDDRVRRFFGTTPMHEMATPAYLIGRTEVTYAQWIEFLDDLGHLGPDARKRHTPYVEAAATYIQGALELRVLGDGSRELMITPENITYTAREGEPVVYPERTSRQRQDWRQLPVSGISAEDADAYAAWLDRTGRVNHARLCTEVEWERAARGADGRSYPHGDRLAPDDANTDVTYGRSAGGYGPDVVGSRPASASPHGLLDASGNIWEITRASSGTGVVARGGSFYQSSRAAHLANRDIITPTYRQVQVGVRICADAP
jgi:formylglycine-generating enzyme required for sulfatase activity